MKCFRVALVVAGLALLHPVLASSAGPARNPFNGRPAGAFEATVAIETADRTNRPSTHDEFFVQGQDCSDSQDCGGPSYCDAYYYCSFPAYACVASPRTGVGQCVYFAECPSCQPAPRSRPGPPSIR